ncbi:hypothetical protein Adt_32861 [Abeliophyllum distichum]|uniref:Uncharacterized protein n=1 Tax=Abeliophyllum distichum TaxID=126358 RepID=A0ABD1QUM0_9LAMI
MRLDLCFLCLVFFDSIKLLSKPTYEHHAIEVTVHSRIFYGGSTTQTKDYIGSFVDRIADTTNAHDNNPLTRFGGFFCGSSVEVAVFARAGDMKQKLTMGCTDGVS